MSAGAIVGMFGGLVLVMVGLAAYLSGITTRRMAAAAPPAVEARAAAVFAQVMEQASGAWQAVVYRPAGQYGNYWQEVARCGHHHDSLETAWDCAIRDPYFGDVEVGALGVAPAA